MKQYIPEKFSTTLIDWGPFVIMGNTVPPRDPDEDESFRPIDNYPGETLPHW